MLIKIKKPFTGFGKAQEMIFDFKILNGLDLENLKLYKLSDERFQEIKNKYNLPFSMHGIIFISDGIKEVGFGVTVSIKRDFIPIRYNLESFNHFYNYIHNKTLKYFKISDFNNIDYEVIDLKKSIIIF